MYHPYIELNQNNHIMTYKYTLLLLGLFLITSCSTEELIERREERLIGSWEIDRARYDADGFFNSDNIINEYLGDELIFFADGSLEYIEDYGEVYTGTWYIDALRGRGDDDETEYTLDADFYDVNGNLVFRWLGDIQRLTFNNFNINISDRDGQLKLRWDRR